MDSKRLRVLPEGRFYEWRCGVIRWPLEPLAEDPCLTLWITVDRRFRSPEAMGWHVRLDVFPRILAGHSVGRIVGAGTMRFSGRQRLNTEDAKHFGFEPPPDSDWKMP